MPITTNLGSGNAGETASDFPCVGQVTITKISKGSGGTVQRLFTYLMTHDSGFAPNPFQGVLTLATCKPGIRRTKNPGDWIAGFASAALVRSSKELGLTIKPNGLVYLMRIGEVLPLAKYFEDPRFKEKKPSPKSVKAGISRRVTGTISITGTKLENTSNWKMEITVSSIRNATRAALTYLSQTRSITLGGFVRPQIPAGQRA